ncbi:HAMP domain-containing histidine kinase [Paenibacillus oenotherae]|uniref:histidine kinase n=1 Tax=Paenibacillus oenotherae TaxID=1435645 RepID=A0ABS7DDA6_9BACL|nr:sensor histidine kinase [Paenibacillus oenotherae]MBW7477621.1 HAMP domain-containing histidine kinase [Paenibacillus oenotherae]
MLVVFFISLLFAIILYVSQPKENIANRWMITFCMSASIGGLSEALLTDIIPELELVGAGADVSALLFEAHIYFQFLAQVVSPYAVLMYAIVYSEIVQPGTRKKLAILLALPMAAMIPFTDFHPDIAINFQALLAWVAPYLLSASWILFYTWRNESNMYRKRDRQRVFVVLVPVWLGVFIFNYVGRAINPDTEIFRLVPIFFGLAFMLFIGYIFLTGAFGIKIKVEQQVLDKSIQIISSGTAILNHTVKNEIEKIKFFFNLAQASIDKKDLEEAKSSIESVFSAIESIDNMVDRIRSKTEEIALTATDVELVQLLHQAIDATSPLCRARGIEIRTEWEMDCTVRCDGVLLAEVMKNLLHNAMEAITAPQGVIHVHLFHKRGGVSVAVSDNGEGIPKEELPRIMEPFFSTKRNIKNHGLGLSFCYMAVRAHDGEIVVHSEVNKGTSVIVHLPKSRIVAQKSQIGLE